MSTPFKIILNHNTEQLKRINAFDEIVVDRLVVFTSIQISLVFNRDRSPSYSIISVDNSNINYFLKQRRFQYIQHFVISQMTLNDLLRQT